MAKRIVKSKAPELKYTCRDCEFSYDWYKKGFGDKLIMCKCRHSEYSKLLSEKQCPQFKLKQNGN